MTTNRQLFCIYLRDQRAMLQQEARFTLFWQFECYL